MCTTLNQAERLLHIKGDIRITREEWNGHYGHPLSLTQQGNFQPMGRTKECFSHLL